MKFSIITPSFRGARWLKLCIASVADQAVEHEHIVQDAGSDDGTLEWLPTDPRVRAFIEKDQGMYDAVNRGLRRASGDILAHLNCDEQYLPGALSQVARFFEQHPETEVVFADALVVAAGGGYICHRKSVRPTRYHSWVGGNLSTLTCATFFRRRVLAERQLYFNPRYRDLGDCHWVLSLLEHHVPMAVLPIFSSVFVRTGQNMSQQPNARREWNETLASAPGWARLLRHWFILVYRFRKALAGQYSQKPFQYAIYTTASPEQRVVFSVTRPTGVWKPPTAMPL